MIRPPGRRAIGGALRAAALAALAGCAFPAPLGEPGGTAAPVDRAQRQTMTIPAARDVERLIGLSREALLAMLGPSTFTRRDGPAEIWRYATDDCFLTLFLHRDVQAGGGGLTVQHVDANPRSRAAATWVNARTCYGQVLEARGIPLAQS